MGRGDGGESKEGGKGDDVKPFFPRQFFILHCFRLWLAFFFSGATQIDQG